MYRKRLLYLNNIIMGRNCFNLQITNSYNGFQANKNYSLLQHHNLHFNKMSLKCYSSSTASFEEVKKLGNQPSKDVYIIDVREPSELQETGVIPSSINIPLGELETALKDLSDKQFLDKYGREKPGKQSAIIYSCLKGTRSCKAQEISQQFGYKNVRSFAGGWAEWEEKNKS